MAYDTVIEGGTVVTASDTVAASICIDAGRIAAIAAPDRPVDADRRIDASGKHVLPGGVDPHVHMMDPGKTDREDFPTGTAAAAVGGITTVGDHHRTKPMVLSADVLEEKRAYLADRARIDFALLAGGHPENVDEIAGLEAAGAVAYKSFTCDVHGVPALQSEAMADLYAEIARVGGISMVHPEDDRMVKANAERLQAAGRTDGSAVPEWRSKAAEQVATATTMTIAEQTGVRVWIAHASHPEIVDIVNHARSRGVDAYTETCPQYLYLTREDVERDAPVTMFTPPAREAADRDELWRRLAAGEIDMVNADHAPSTMAQKEAAGGDVFEAPFGIPGVETVLPLLLNGVAEDRIDLQRVAAVFATNPAKITDLYPTKGTIRVGSDADVVIVDLDEAMTLRNEDVVAKCGWTPFDGLSVRGVPETTLVRGEPVVLDGEVVGEPGYGRFVARQDLA